jgi:hypothetical protein
MWFMGYMAQSRLLRVKWETLIKVSEFCLTAGLQGIVKAELIKQIPGNYTWKLWIDDLGDFGDCVIAKYFRPGVTGVFFTGLALNPHLTEDTLTIEGVLFQEIIYSYFSTLNNSIVWKSEGNELIPKEFILPSYAQSGLIDGQERNEIYLPNPIHEKSQKRLRDVEKLSQTNMTDQQMADALWCSVSTIRRARKKLGIKKPIKKAG